MLRYEEHKKKLQELRELRKQAALEAAAGAAAVQAAASAAAGVALPPPVPPPLEPSIDEASVEPLAKGVISKLEQQVKEAPDLDLFTLVLKSARVEDLGPEQQQHYRRVEATGIGICSRCRYSSGCLNCDVEKAWRYVEVGIGATSD